VYAGGKTVNVPISKGWFQYVISCSCNNDHYDVRPGLNRRHDVVNSGRACVHCDNCAGRY
jgi:hypothetical protein